MKKKSKKSVKRSNKLKSLFIVLTDFDTDKSIRVNFNHVFSYRTVDVYKKNTLYSVTQIVSNTGSCYYVTETLEQIKV